MSFLPSSRIDNLLSRRLLFVIFKNCKLDHARVGISVGKKLGNAVCRNKVKRQLRSIVDDIFTFEEGYDLIIIVRPAYANKLFEENKNEMKENQNRINKRFLKK